MKDSYKNTFYKTEKGRYPMVNISKIIHLDHKK